MLNNFHSYNIYFVNCIFQNIKIHACKYIHLDDREAMWPSLGTHPLTPSVYPLSVSSEQGAGVSAFLPPKANTADQPD